MRKALVVALITLLAFVAGCGSKSSSSSGSSAASASSSASTNKTHLAKTKFALHAGLAFGAFHRYIYKPYKRGDFSGGLLHHKSAKVKAALAAAFAYHETRLALNAARGSKILSTLLKPLLALQTSLSSLRNGFRRGSVNAGTIQSANSDTSLISKESASKGQPIQDQPTPQLGG
jgi:hypothetical protein